jgi:ERCC4-type nuclease
MIILIDSREQQYKHITNKLEQLNIPYKIKKLDFGDYSFEVDGVSYEKKIVIERKASINEIITNFTKGRKRFENEFKRAKGCKVILMIEALESDIDKHNYKSSMTPSKVRSFLKTWTYFFGLDLNFVDKFDSAEFILGVFKSYLEKE